MQALNIFQYLDIHKNGDVVFKATILEFYDPLTIDNKLKQMKNMYPEAFKYSPQNYLIPIGNPNINNYSYIGCFPDNSHKHNISKKRCLIRTSMYLLCI